MPLYEYQCEACGHRFEKIQKFSDPLVEECPNCGQKKVHKLVSSPAIQFKGTGWYITDYAKKSGADSSSKSSDAKDGDSKGSVSAGSESKTGDAKSAETNSSDAKTPDSKSSDTKPATTTQS